MKSCIDDPHVNVDREYVLCGHLYDDDDDDDDDGWAMLERISMYIY